MTTAIRRGASCMLRSVGLAAGLWGLTHLITHALLAEAPTDSGAVAQADSLGALTIAALALLVVSASVLGVLCASTAARRTRPRAGSSTLALAATAPAVYIAIEVATHVGSHHDGAPPFGLLVVGGVAHAGVALVARQLWAIFLDRAIPAIAVYSGSHAAPPAPACSMGGVVGFTRWTPIDLNPGRAPPV
ncbi:hypothetical protein [Pseudonocardia dioxanivorans]|uniref:hypothetical protein n=1 Tax=Pseudonocardia dioxanivorans TaxID=240495 RepID=UPI001F192B0B|nr:hypothetical protein [Pseudonocardia dioxanivorans]